MNIALSTILLFLFLLPGLAFRRFYFTSEFSKEYFKTTPAEVLLMGIIPTITLHWLGLHVVKYVTPIDIEFFPLEFHIPKSEINIRLIVSYFLNNADKGISSELIDNITSKLDLIVAYNVSLIFFGALIGFLFKVLVRNFKLDRKVKILRFQNEWHYILTSEILDFPRVKKLSPYTKEGRLSAVYVDALVEASEKDGAILYSGILEDYKLSKNGGLDLIYLTNAFRRPLSADPAYNEEERHDIYYMPDHYFILKYEQVKNLNIFYDFLVEKKSKSDKAENIQITIGLLIVVAIFAVAINFLGWIWGIIVGIAVTSIISSFADEENEDGDNKSKDQ